MRNYNIRNINVSTNIKQNKLLLIITNKFKIYS